MIRFVVGPEAEIVPDVAGTLPGRGIWVRADRATVELAQKKRAFDRSARRSVRVPDGLAGRLEALLAQRCRDAIGLARRSGVATAGFERVQETLRAGRAGLLLAAHDGGRDGRRKLAALAGNVPVLSVLTADELGQAFGRERIIHAVLSPGRLADRLRIDAGRLSGLRASDSETEQHA
jgi:predicted RNA-binding protein YlxR (DUF448 family)